MAEGYLFRVSDQPNAPLDKRTYWYSHIADRTEALSAVMLAAALTAGVANVEFLGSVGAEVFSMLGIERGETRRH